MEEVIGLNVKNLLDFVEDEHGRAARDGIVSTLPPASRRRFSERIIVSDWYPLADHLALYGAICSDLHGGNVEEGFEMGRRMARRRLSVFQRMFLLFRDPAYVIERSAATWAVFYRPSRMVHEMAARGQARARIVGMDVRPPDRFFCNVLAAHIVSFAEAAGAREIEIRHPRCRSAGDPACEFEGEWK